MLQFTPCRPTNSLQTTARAPLLAALGEARSACRWAGRRMGGFPVGLMLTCRQLRFAALIANLRSDVIGIDTDAHCVSHTTSAQFRHHLATMNLDRSGTDCKFTRYALV